LHGVHLAGWNVQVGHADFGVVVMANKPPPLDDEMKAAVVRLLKHANLHLDFLNEFERDFVRDCISMYRKFARDYGLSQKQLDTLHQIGRKLFYFKNNEGL
jgi:hypothetical protein